MAIKSVKYPIMMVLPTPEDGTMPILTLDAGVADPYFPGGMDWTDYRGNNYLAILSDGNPVVINPMTGFARQNNGEWLTSDLSNPDITPSTSLMPVAEMGGLFYAYISKGVMCITDGSAAWSAAHTMTIGGNIVPLDSLIAGRDGLIFAYAKDAAGVENAFEVDVASGDVISQYEETRVTSWRSFCFVDRSSYQYYVGTGIYSSKPIVCILDPYNIDSNAGLIRNQFNPADTAYACISYDTYYSDCCVVGSRADNTGCIYLLSGFSNNLVTLQAVDVTPTGDAAAAGFLKVVSGRERRHILLSSNNKLWITQDFETYSQVTMPESIGTIVDIAADKYADKLYVQNLGGDGSYSLYILDIGAELAPGTYMPYEVIINGETTYAGKSSRLNVDVSHIIQDHFNSDLVDLNIPNGISAIATYYVKNKRTGEVVVSDAAQLVVNDYNNDFVSEYVGLVSTSDLIGKMLHPRQLLFVSGINDSGAIHVSVVLPGGETATYAPSAIEYDAQGTYRFNIDTDTVQTVTVTLSDDAVDGVSIVNEYTLDPCAGDYALYFVNRRGGLSSINMRGSGKRTSNATESKIKGNYDRLNRLSRETRITERVEEVTYQLNSGWLPDEESAKMDDLFTSPKVWMHDLVKDQIFSCHITDTMQDRKLFQTDRRKNYTVKIAISQTHVRR